MKIQFWSLGKQHEPYVEAGVEMFTKRVSNYYSIEWKIISPLKNAASLPEEELKQKEAERILSYLKQDDWLVLLDERGKLLSSPDLAKLIQQRSNESVRSLVFLIAGAFGPGPELIKRANFKWSLSPLVFPHQLVRLILAEQVYRACSIIKNEKYHH